MKSWALGWSDIVFLGIFENGHYAADELYFYESNFKNRQIWPLARRLCSKVFTFKNHRDLTKEYIFCRNHSTLLGMKQLISIATMTTRQLVQGFCVYTIQYIYIIQQPATCFWPLHIVTLQRASYAGSFGYLENILLELH